MAGMSLGPARTHWPSTPVGPAAATETSDPGAADRPSRPARIRRRLPLRLRTVETNVTTLPRPRERTSELGVSVIVDDTASHRFLRDTWREVAAQGKVRFQIIWLDIDPVTQRHRLQANRSAAARPDVVDRVMAEHRASFEPPLEENAIRVEARNARELETIADLFHSLSTHAGPQA